MLALQAQIKVLDMARRILLISALALGVMSSANAADFSDSAVSLAITSQSILKLLPKVEILEVPHLHC